MTFLQLKEYVDNLKILDDKFTGRKFFELHPVNDEMGLWIPLISRNLFRLHTDYEIGLLVTSIIDGKRFVCSTERGSAQLKCVFYNECVLFDYLFYWLKKSVDGTLDCDDRLYYEKRLRRPGVSDQDYSFCGEREKNIFCTERKIFKDEIPRGSLKSSCSYELYFDLADAADGKAWDICKSGGKAEKYGTFFKRADAYDFLFYLAAEKHLW